jgi:hypothetical protein
VPEVVEAVSDTPPVGEEVGSTPLQAALVLPPEAVQAVAPVVAQLSTKVPPGATVEGVAVRAVVNTGPVGAEPTLTSTVCATLPPAPMQFSA